MHSCVIHTSLQNKQFRTSARQMNATGVHWIVPHKAGCVALCDQETLDDGTLGKCLDSERKS